MVAMDKTKESLDRIAASIQVIAYTTERRATLAYMQQALSGTNLNAFMGDSGTLRYWLKQETNEVRSITRWILRTIALEAESVSSYELEYVANSCDNIFYAEGKMANLESNFFDTTASQREYNQLSDVLDISLKQLQVHLKKTLGDIASV